MGCSEYLKASNKHLNVSRRVKEVISNWPYMHLVNTAYIESVTGSIRDHFKITHLQANESDLTSA